MRSVWGWAAALMVVAVMGLAGCSNNDNGPTSPGGGGGGGGGGTAFDSGTLTAPASYSHTFATSGSFGYHCRFHESLGMVGTVTVADSAANTTATVAAAGTRFSPASVTIRRGGTVTWNVTDGTHTVTSN